MASLRRAPLLLALALLLGLLPARSALAGSFVVSSLADTNTAGTLRWAITQANASAGPHTITFSAFGTITLTAPLPGITQGGVTINGEQGGVPGVMIDGSQLQTPGILLRSSNNVIRGLALSGFRRDISLQGPHGGAGIEISGAFGAADNNLVQNCYLGTNLAGTAAAISANELAGLIISGGANNNIVDGNVIAGNTQYGVYVTGSVLARNPKVSNGNIIRNNKIGLAKDGQTAVPNKKHGVFLADKHTNTTLGPGNVISGNGDGTPSSGAASDAAYYGVYIRGQLPDAVGAAAGAPVSGTRVIGNYIGTDASGARAVGNTDGGVAIDVAADAQVGGSGAGEANVISGNLYGVIVRDSTSSGTPVAGIANNVVRNNLIGLQPSGNAPVDTGGASIPPASGVRLELKARGITIGPANVISGNKQHGLEIAAVSGATVKGNLIGTNAAGTAAVPNTLNGIYITDRILTAAQSGTASASNNTIGGPSAGDGNLISGNLVSGILLRGSLVTNNTIQGNRVELNAGDGIVIDTGTGNRVTQTATSRNGSPPLYDNASGLALLSGGNTGLATPGVSGLTLSGATLNGTLSTSCSGGCTLEVFDSSDQQNAEGPYYLASATVSGGGPFSISLGRSCQPFLTFTVTSSAGNTSPFSQALGVSGCTGGPPQNGAKPTLSAATPSSQNGTPGGPAVVFNHTLTNSGNAAGSFTLSASGPAGWSIQVSPSSVSLNASQSQAVQVSVSVPAGVDAGTYNVTVTAAVGGQTASQTDQVVVPLTPGLTFTPPTQTKQAGPGQQVCFDHTLTNTGNGADSFSFTVTPPAGWTAAPVPNVSLAKGAAQTVTVCVTVPQNAASTSFTTQVVARSTTAPNPAVTVTDTVTVLAVASPQFSAAQTQSANPGATVTFNHTLTNVGNADGTFTLALSLPAGWTVVTPPQASVTLAQGASANVSFTVQVPAGAIAGPYGLTLRAANQANPQIAAQVVDTVQVNRQPGLTLTAPAGDLRDPGTVVTYTFTLVNNGNFTDTVSLAAAASLAAQGWQAQLSAPSVTVPPKTSVQIPVRVTIPIGQVAGTENTTTLTATSDSGIAPVSASVKTTVRSVPGVRLTPPVNTQRTTPGGSLTFTFSLINSGSVIFTPSGNTITLSGVPAGWTSQLTPQTFGALGPGQSTTVTLTLTPPANAPNGQTDVTITATAQTVQGPASATAIARARIGPPIAVDIAPNRSSSALPGTVVQYTHYITNTGFVSETFRLSALSSLGWETFVGASSVTLRPDQSAVITVSLTIPNTAPATLPGDPPHTLVVQVQSTSDPSVQDQAVDTTSILQVGALSFSPDRISAPAPGRTLTFEHTLINLGNAPDTFTITVTQDLNWNVQICVSADCAPPPAETPLPITPGLSFPVIVKVEVPANASSTVVNRVVVRATSQADPSVFERVVDTVSPVATNVIGASVSVYLPIVQRQ